MDVGLLRRLAGFPAEALVATSPLTSDMRGALTENYVLTELVAQGIERVGFWKSGNRAEVDFVVQEAAEIIPVEVKAAENTRSKSLARYRELYTPAVSVKMSLADMRIREDAQGILLDLPLMLVWKMREMARELFTIRAQSGAFSPPP